MLQAPDVGNQDCALTLAEKRFEGLGMSFRFDVVESSFMLPLNLPSQVIEHNPAIV